jgi:chorismate mutase
MTDPYDREREARVLGDRIFELNVLESDDDEVAEIIAESLARAEAHGKAEFVKAFRDQWMDLVTRP